LQNRNSRETGAPRPRASEKKILFGAATASSVLFTGKKLVGLDKQEVTTSSLQSREYEASESESDFFAAHLLRTSKIEKVVEK